MARPKFQLFSSCRKTGEELQMGRYAVNHLDFSFVTMFGDTASRTNHNVHSFFMP